MKLSIIAFTRNGGKLAHFLQERLREYSIVCHGYIVDKYREELPLTPLTDSLSHWTKDQFEQADAILFISACGIAVRAIAPYVKDKTKDPAVMVMDEQANYCISLLSGHIGGANKLTTLISCLCHAVPVITTATDINHQFSVDLFAVKNELVIQDMTLAKEISANILDGKPVGLYSDFDIDGIVPDGLHLYKDSESKNAPELGFSITLNPLKARNPFKHTLYLVPRFVSIGIGCKKDTPFDGLHDFVCTVLKEQGLSFDCIQNIASIELKAKEPAILEFAQQYNLSFLTFSAEELNSLPGDFHESEFVKSITGVGNVCERAATLASNHGRIIRSKQAKDGVTVALSLCNRRITF